MANWDNERRVIWRLIMDLRDRIIRLEKISSERKEGSEQPLEAAGAEAKGLDVGGGPC
jgi:hypothetical protein